MTKDSEYTHAALVEKARLWLMRKHAVVVTELASVGEIADAIGWSGGISTLVEVKVSRSDYYRDKEKYFRRYPEQGVGNNRYYFAPKGLLVPQNLPHGWGLLEFDGSRVWRTKDATPFMCINHVHEKRLLMSALRRIGQATPKGISVKAYYSETGDTATLTLGPEMFDTLMTGQFVPTSEEIK